jgi:hypothetical protein
LVRVLLAHTLSHGFVLFFVGLFVLAERVRTLRRMAALHGGFAWRLCMAALHGGFAWRLCMACRAREQPHASQVPRERPQARARAGGERTSLGPPREYCKSRTADICRVLTVPHSVPRQPRSGATGVLRGVRAVPRRSTTQYGRGQHRTVTDNTAVHGTHNHSRVPQPCSCH